jgi:hypothetical protein
MSLPDPNSWYVAKNHPVVKLPAFIPQPGVRYKTQKADNESMTIAEKIVLAMLILISGEVFVGTLYLIWIIICRLIH